MKRFAVLLLVGFSVSAAVPEPEAVRTIIGEAANQGFTGMVAVGNVLRHRGSTKGFCGRTAPHIDKQPAWVWAQARRAWQHSATNDVTGGATHFENTTSFGEPYWARNMKKTVKIRDHQFYRD